MPTSLGRIWFEVKVLVTNQIGSAGGTRRVVVVSDARFVVLKEGSVSLACPGWTVFYYAVWGKKANKITLLRVVCESEGRDLTISGNATIWMGRGGHVLVSDVERVFRRAGVPEPALSILAQELAAQGSAIWRRLQRAGDAVEAILSLTTG